VTLTDSSVVTVPIFDVKSVILSMLHDRTRMQPKNFAHGYDLFSGKVTAAQSTDVNEIHTGALWNSAVEFYCQHDSNVLPLAMVCFYDKTHTDLHGSLSCAPFVMTFSFFNEKARGSEKFYSVLGYIPNLSYGLGSSSNKSARDKLQDEHKCLKLITNQIQQLSNGFQTTVMGKFVTVKPWIHFIAGDTSGHNNIAGQYNSSYATFPYRDCKCTCQQLADTTANCTLTKMDDYLKAKQNNCLNQFSIHDIDNAFIGLPFGDLKHGLFGSLPAEMLHVSGNGIMKYQLKIIQKIIGSGNNKQQTLNSLDVLHHNMVRDALTQSEKDIPRMSDRNGVTDGTKMTASERVGNMFILLCVMHTENGKQLFADGCKQSSISFNQMKHCLKLQLSFEKWVHESNTINEIDRATNLLDELLTMIQKCFPRQAGNGWCIPKMHSMAKMLHYMKQFGSAKNFSGQVGERVLKSIVKNHAHQTQRRVNVFATQVAQREFETHVYRHAYGCLNVSNDYMKLPNNLSEIVDCKGKFTLNFSSSDLHGRGDVSVIWADNTRNKSNVAVHDVVTHALRSYACSAKWTDRFSIEGYTSARLCLDGYDSPILFHANDWLFGGKRYHYCLVNFSDDDINDKPKTCPAKVLAFIRFVTNGFPAPSSENNSDVNMQSHDSKLYAVIHTSNDYLSKDEMDDKFISSFSLGDIKSCVYIVDVGVISDPLFVFSNCGTDALQHFCALPYRSWGNYFRKRLK